MHHKIFFFLTFVAFATAADLVPVTTYVMSKVI